MGLRPRRAGYKRLLKFLIVVSPVFLIAVISFAYIVSGQGDNTVLRAYILSSGGDAEFVIGEPVQGVSKNSAVNLYAGYIYTKPLEQIPPAEVTKPTLNPVVTPTNKTPQLISGTKAANTSIWLNGQKIVELGPGTTWSYSLNLTEGENWFSITAKNSHGNESASVVDSITLDTMPPAKPAVNPVITPTNQNTQMLSGTKEANSSIWINGIEKIPLNSSTAWSLNVSLNEGLNNFSVIAKDSLGNASGETAVSILLDTSPPTMPVVTDDGDFTNVATQLHAVWNSQDAQTDIIEYQYAIGTTVNGIDVTAWASTGTNTEVTRTGLSLTAGKTYYISVKAKNAAGSWSQVGCSNGIKLNQGAPVILSVQPPDKSITYIGDTVNFSVSAQDPEGQSLLYQFLADGKIIQPWQPSSTFNWITTDVTPDIHIIKVEVSDGYNKVSRDLEICFFRKPIRPPQ